MPMPQHNLGPSRTASTKLVVPRERLQALGQLILAYNVTTIIAPAGYGKTVWMSSLLENPGWPSTVWISLDHQDAEPSILLYHLIHAFRRLWPGFGQNPLRTLSSVENIERDWPIVLLSLLDELPLDSHLILVLDDLHLLYGNRVSCAVIEYLLKELPKNINIVLIARSSPPFKLYHQELKNELLQINSMELLFTEEEAQTLFSNMELQLSANDASSLYARTEGWAVGLRLLGIYLKQQGSSLNDAMQVLNQEDSNLYRYLMNEFLETMPADMREFFIDASLLPYLEARLCDDVFQRSDSSDMLETLRSYGLFSPLAEKEGVWQMHHLIGAWLQDSVSKLRSQEHISVIRKQAAVYFEQSGNINRAIEQAVLSEDWERAAGLIHQYGYEYFTRDSRMDILYKWIEELPEELVEKDCWLLYFKGLSILYIDNDQAFQILSAAADKAVQNSDVKCESGSLLAMLLSSIFIGDLEKSESAGARLLGKPALLKDPRSRGEALIAALLYAMATENLQEGMRISRQVLRLNLHPELLMWAYYTTSHILFRQGNLTQSRQLIEETLAMPFIQENERRIITGYQILNDLAFTMGDHRTFEETSKICLDLGKKYNMPGIIGRVYYDKAHQHYREGRLTEARQYFDQAYEYFVSGGVVHFANQAAVDILLLRITNGENAQELLQEMLDLKAKFEELPYGVGVDYVVNSLVGIAAMEAGELELAGQMFERSSRRWHDIGAKQHQAGTNLLMAHLLLLQGQEKLSDSLLRAGLAAAEAYQWENFWEWHHETVYTLCRRAMQKNIHARWAAHLLSRWFPEQSRQELGSLLIAPDEPARSLGAEFLQQSFKETGKTVFHVFYLGGFRLFVNGIEIEEPDWKTKKAENLFKFLVADRTQHNKDYLMQQLWPDGDSQSSDGKLRMTLSYVRKALATAGLPPDCIVMQRGIISINADFKIYCDYESFSQEARKALLYSEINHPYAIPALEQSIRIYNGEFLPEDIYEDWTGSLRIALHNLHLEVLAQLAQAQYTKQNLSAALQTCNTFLALEPVDETLIRLAMDILWKMGKKQKSLTLYCSLESTLAQEYRTTPEPKTIALYHKIQGVIKQSSLPI